MTAISSVLELLDADARIVLGNDLYHVISDSWAGASGRLLVDLTDSATFEAALQEGTRIVWVETPSNPMLRLTDLAPSRAAAVSEASSAWPAHEYSVRKG